MGFHFSFADCFTALQDNKFDHENTIEYVTSDRFKPWKVEKTNKRYGHHEEMKNQAGHRSGPFVRKVKLQFYEEEPEIEIATLDPAMPIVIEEPIVIEIAQAPKKEAPKKEAPKV